MLFLLIPATVFCQDKTFAQNLVSAIDSFSNRMPAEKVFIQTDKPYYSNTDTLWLKAYVLDADLNYSQQSGLLYTELINDTGKVVVRQSMPVKLGISFGQIILDSTVRQGGYILRAYTNWMQNQGEQSYFTRPLYISKTANNHWLVNAGNKTTFKDGKYNIESALQVTNMDHHPIRLREMRLRIMDGNKTLNRENVQTDLDGKLHFNFNLPDRTNTKKIHIIAEDMRKGAGGRKLVVPVNVNRPEFTDLQFMPEGGQLVTGLSSHVGFKAIGENGNGVAISGKVTDSKDNVITTFKSDILGIGSFKITPVANESYKAIITFTGGITKTYTLPTAKPEGIVLHINNPEEGDSLSVTINASAAILNTPNRYSLVAQSNGKICYAANLSFRNGIISGRVNKKDFRSGITRFTLFNSDRKPIAERLVFIDHHDELHIAIIAGKQAFQPKDSVALMLQVTDKDNKPVQGSFSLAVTDDEQVKTDTSNTPDIKTYMLLTGDLKGNIEQPGYYFDKKNPDGNEALDNLLLTQGWVNYDWQNVFNPKYQPAFKPQPEIEVTGQISRTGGKVVGGLPVMLLSTRKPFLMMDTVADAKGRFVFRHLPKIDTGNFMIQVKDKKGRMFEAMVAVDEFTPAPEPQFNTATTKPWYVNTDTTLLHYANSARDYNQIIDDIKYPAGSHHLAEVKIKALKVIKGSHNLNGPGEADQVLDEKDMTRLEKMPLIDLLLKRIKGFRKYDVFDKGVRFIFDGLDVMFFFDGNIDRSPYDYYDRILSQFSAEDIKGIEVLYNEKYNGKYTLQYDPEIMARSMRSAWPAYIEITTWSGNGLFEKRKSSNYLYKPLPVTWPIQFYKPKYTSKSNNTLADLQSTVLWEPNIITNSDGKATVWFYAKGKPSNYTGIVQGSDLSGKVGVGRVKIEVK